MTRDAASSPPKQTLPFVYGRYLLLSRLAEGGMGELFVARLGELEGFEKLVAVKRILPDLSRDTSFVERFIEEAKIAIQLSHQNIVPVYEVGRAEEQYFLAMEYIRGRDLLKLMRRATERGIFVPIDIALLVAREIASGLAYAHRMTDSAGAPLGLVHCDISPPNVLVSFEGEVRIIDFGIARSTMLRASAGVGFGKVGYMAPEQLASDGSFDRRVDIYSVGVILYELLSGQPMHRIVPGVEPKHHGVRPPSTIRPQVSPALDKIVMRAIDPKPTGRFQSAGQLRDAIQTALASISPTMTGDVLGRFVRDLFRQEASGDLDLSHALAHTPIAPFRARLIDAAGRTELLVGRGSTERGTAEMRATSSFGLAAGGATRVMSRWERGDVAEQPPSPQAGRGAQWLWRLGLGVLGLVLVGAVVGLALSHRGAAEVDHAAGQGGGPHTLARPSIVITDSSTPPPARQLGRRSTAVTSRRPRKGRPTSRRRRRAREARASHKPSSRQPSGDRRRLRGIDPRADPAASARAIRRKFRRVRLEYQVFSSAYGARLDRLWQRILFANTYSSGASGKKYRKLDRMLDDLRRRMRAVDRESDS